MTKSEIAAVFLEQALKDEHDKSFARRLSVNRLLLRKRLEEYDNDCNDTDEA